MFKWCSGWRLVRVLVPGGVAVQLSGCLSDQQITSIITSVVTTGLSTLLNQFLVSAAGGA
ncbi:MAG: hypothetical protein LC135_08050 [Phycisphaerae bacterium]|jgi:hypothetical protein|nr:hypothetical protein [Phycisphaerae bacterium]MCZ2399806.1 hypothetical protein [Phycisphaerae bacterium]